MNPSWLSCMSSLSNYRRVIVFFFAVILSMKGHATWSIVAVDPETGDVGYAVASCTFRVHGIAKAIPGKGAIVVQAKSNPKVRNKAFKLLGTESNATDILEELSEEPDEPDLHQYGIAVFLDDQHMESQSLAYSGKDIPERNGSLTERTFSIQGNTLVNENVLSAAFDAFVADGTLSLEERLMAALLAASKAGGDHRCGEQTATSSAMAVYKKTDKPQHPFLSLAVYGLERDDAGLNAVELMNAQFQKWKKESKDRKSTQLFLIP